MPASTLLRYLILASVAYTANANRRHFGLATTWVIHLTGNGLALILPDLLRLVDTIVPPGDSPESTVDRIRAFLNEVIVENPAYVGYIAPVALAYTVSHPRFNIYAGPIGEKQILGFGMDTIPHASTAYSLTAFMNRMLEVAPSYLPRTSQFGRIVRKLAERRVGTTAVALAALSAVYETAEFVINRVELAEANGDETKINMHWTVPDTVTDLISNLGGWLAATAVHNRRPAPRLEAEPELAPAMS